MHFEKRFKQAGFIRRNHLKRIGRRRDYILSGIFKLFADEVLPGMASSRETLMLHDGALREPVSSRGSIKNYDQTPPPTLGPVLDIRLRHA